MDRTQTGADASCRASSGLLHLTCSARNFVRHNNLRWVKPPVGSGSPSRERGLRPHGLTVAGSLKDKVTPEKVQKVIGGPPWAFQQSVSRRGFPGIDVSFRP